MAWDVLPGPQSEGGTAWGGGGGGAGQMRLDKQAGTTKGLLHHRKEHALVSRQPGGAIHRGVTFRSTPDVENGLVGSHQRPSPEGLLWMWETIT